MERDRIVARLLTIRHYLTADDKLPSYLVDGLDLTPDEREVLLGRLSNFLDAFVLNRLDSVVSYFTK